LFVLALAVVFALVLAFTAGAQEKDGSGPERGFALPSLPVGIDAKDLPRAGERGAQGLEEELEREQGRIEERKQELASVGARAARERSRTAHLGASDAAAAILAGQKFGDLLNGAAAGSVFADIARGREVQRFVDDYTMVLEGTAEQPPILVESPLPVRAVADDGRKRAVDLSLEPIEGGLKPVNAASDIKLPASLADGVELGEIMVVPAGTADVQVAEDGGSHAVYANAEIDTDVIVTPLATGIELFWQLRSPRAAEQVAFDLDLPEGAFAEEGKGGSVVVSRDGKALAVVRPPAAVDAQGQDVPVKMSVSATQVVLSVPHREKDLAYPILVDPVIEDFWVNTGSWIDQSDLALQRLGYWPVNGGSSGGFGMYYACRRNLGLVCDAEVNRPNYTFTKNDGLHVYAWPNPWTYSAGEYAEWVYPAPGTSTRIAEAHLYSYYHRRGGSQHPYMYTGIWSNGANAWAGTPNTLVQDIAGQTLSHYGGGTTGPQAVVWGLKSGINVMNGNYRDGYIGAAIIALTDPEAPSINGGAMQRQKVPEDGGDPVWEDRNHATQWVKPQDQLVVRPNATDPGLGVKKVWVDDGDSETNGVVDSGCVGNYTALCWDNWAQTQGFVEFSVKNMVDGSRTVTMYAQDPLGQTGSAALPIKVDGQVPTVDTPTGTLWPYREQDHLAPEQQPALPGGSYTISASATDPAPNGVSPAPVRSGVERMEIRVDGQVEHSVDSACPQGNCPLSINWNYNTSAFNGRHKIEIVAIDGAGNRNSKSFWVNNNPAITDLIYPADGEITSGKIALQAKTSDGDLTWGGVRFEYRKRPIGTWTPINSYVTDLQGNPPGGWDDVHPFPNWQGATAYTKKLVWDARNAIAWGPAQEGKLQVRGFMIGDESRTQVANVDVDFKGLSADNAKEAMGPGNVDLLTGNFNYQATDASLGSFAGPIQLTRSFNSLDPDTNPKGPLGPGWVSSAPLAGVSDYSSLVVQTDLAIEGWVDVFDSAGQRIRFQKTGQTTFESPAGFEALTLTRVVSSGQPDKYTIKDLDGITTTFVTLAGATKLVPSRVDQPGTPAAASYNYQAYQGEPRLKRVVAPSPPNTDCDQINVAAENLPVGCRVLELNYQNFPSFGAERLTSIQQFASNGTAMVPDTVAQFSYYTDGRLSEAWDPRISPALKETYAYTPGHRLATITPPGEAPWSMVYFSTGLDYLKLDSVSRTADDSGLATSRMRYRVPLTVAGGGPYDMTPTELAKWGQADHPSDATALVPPDESGSGLTRATVHYMNPAGQIVNTAARNGGISVTEYDPKGNPVRELTPANRERATLYMGDTPAKAAYSRKIDTQRTYSASGLRLLEELGPERWVKLDSGSEVLARAHTATTYDEGYAPQGTEPPQLHLPTTVQTGAKVGSAPDVDVRTVKTEYDWGLRKPTRTTVDAVSGGLNIKSETSYNTAGLETASWQPKSNGSDAGTTKTVYYGDSSDEDCADHIEWFNLPCKTKPAAQPGTAGLPDLAVTTYTYDRYGNVLTATERIGEVSRTSTTTYDSAGRKETESVTTDEPEEEEGGGEPPEGLVAAYGFDEGSGASVGDASGSGNAGTISGASWSTSGKFGNALDFDGVNDRVTVPDSDSLDLTSSGMTLSAWIKPDAVDDYRTVLMKEGSTNYSYTLYSSTNTGDRPSFEFQNNQLLGPSALSTGAWAHLAATYDGAMMRIYINGVQVGTDPDTDAIPVTSNQLSIGRNTIWGEYFDGLIDEVRIYDRTLTPAEIQTDKDTAVAEQTGGSSGGGGGEPPEGLVAAYGFDEGSGASVGDASGSGNAGTISGASWSTSGKFGNALDFDGVNDRVTVPDSDSLDLTSSGMTLSAWIKPDAVDDYRTVLMKEGSTNYSYTLYSSTNTGDRPSFEFQNNQLLGPSALSTGAWAHLAATYDGAMMRIYINGVQVGTDPDTDAIPVTSNQLSIGRNTIWGEYFDGLIDEVRIYDRTLTPAEIQTDKDTSIAAQTTPDPDPNQVSEPVPTVTYGYSSTTGRPTTVTADGKTTTTTYDNIGRVIEYTDRSAPDGTTSTTDYDKLNRPTETDDGKGTQDYSYDATSGALASMSDSHAGTFTASYDADGRMVSKTYPNGMKADTTYDPSGSPVALKYTKISNCSSNCVWIDEQVTESIHGQWRTHSWELSSQEYTYDQAGRLTRVEDDVQSPTPVAGCTIRSYAFDANSNRTSMNTKAPAGNGDCQPGAAGTSKTYSYDDADRLTGTGIQYDKFGRMTSIPAQHSGGGVLTYTYYANEQVRTIAQDGVSKTYALDPTGRQRQTVASGGTTYTETLHYSNGSDSPSWTSVANGQGVETSWERNITGIDGDLAAIRTNNAQGDTTVLHLQNLHGDIIATASTDPNATALTARFETDEFGNPRQPGGADRRYGWLGGKQRRTELASGVIQMGVRSYVPSLGRFTSVDPVRGGSATTYDYANADPVNSRDLTGLLAGDDDPYKRTYAYTDTMHDLKTGRVIMQISVSVTISMSGRNVRFAFSATKIRGAGILHTKRIHCVEEHLFDNGCGSRKPGGKPFHLKDDANYHLEWTYHGTSGKRHAIGGDRSAQFSCRKGRKGGRACRFN
jgi:RHS repeat-associated protein